MKTEYNNLEDIIKLDTNKLILLSGTGGVGKSTVGLNIINSIVSQNVHGVIFNLETSKETILQKVNNLEYISIDDTPNITVDYIEEKCKKIKQTKNIKLVLIDYLQLINYENDIEKVSKKLKVLSQELDLTILVLSQLSTNLENKKPTIEDLTESQSVVDMSDVVIFLYKENDITNIIISKNKVEM